MKAAAIGYARAETLAQALQLLSASGGEARVIAGGQSLVASLNLRLVDGANLIDINQLDELKGIVVADKRLRVGALTRHEQLADHPEVARLAPALAQAAPLIAHAAIRTRGTIGGSLAYADPAAELPACAVALGADIVLVGPEGERKVAASDFFIDLFETACQANEIIKAVEFPAIEEGQRDVVLELARRSGDYALVGIVARFIIDAGTIQGGRIAFFGVGATPVLAEAAMKALAEGKGMEAAAEALASDLDPPDDFNGTGSQKLHLAQVLLRRAGQAATDSAKAI